MQRRRILVLLGLLVALVLTVLVSLATMTFDSPELGDKVLSTVGSYGGVEIQADEFRVALLDGLRLRKVHAVATLPAGKVTLDADTIVLESRLGPLLKRQIHVDRVVLRRPHIVLEEAPVGETEVEPPAAAAAASGMSAKVVEVLLEDATFEVRPADPEMPPLLVEGFHLALRDLDMADTGLLMTSLRGAGEMKIDRVVTPDAQVVDATGDLSLGDGNLTLTDFDFQVVDAGRMKIPEMQLHLADPDLSYDMDLRGDLDIGGILGVKASKLGTATMVFEGQGPVADVFASHGGGRVEIQPGNLPDAKLFQLIDRTMGDTILVGAAYELLDIGYTLQNQRVSIDAFDIGTPNVGLTISGTAGLDGSMAMEFLVRVPRDMLKIDEIPPEVFDILEDEQGRVVLPFTVGGASADPSVVLARKTLIDAAKQGAKREAKKKAAEEVGKAIGRLFGGDDDGR